MTYESDLEKESFNSACWNNGYHPYSISSKEVGFKMNSLRHSQQSLQEQNIAEDFLINSRMNQNDREAEASISSYFDDAGLMTTSLIDEKDITDEKVEHKPNTANFILTSDQGKGYMLLPGGCSCCSLGSCSSCSCGALSHQEIDL